MLYVVLFSIDVICAVVFVYPLCYARLQLIPPALCVFDVQCCCMSLFLFNVLSLCFSMPSEFAAVRLHAPLRFFKVVRVFLSVRLFGLVILVFVVDSLFLSRGALLVSCVLVRSDWVLFLFFAYGYHP